MIDTLSDYSKITVKKGLDWKSNTVEVVLNNAIDRTPVSSSYLHHRYVDDSGELMFLENDTITIKARYTDTKIAVSDLTDNDTLTVADLTEWKTTLDKAKTPVSLKCVDKSFAILNKLHAEAILLSAGYTSPTLIKHLVESATESGTGDGTFDVSAELLTESTYAGQVASVDTKYIQTRRINDSVFPVTSISKVYKPVYEWIEDLSSLEHTNDFNNRNGGGAEDEDNPIQNRQMRYFIDAQNKFHWFYPDDVTDYTINYAEHGTDGTVLGSSLSKSTFDVVNMVVFNCGLDMYGVGTLNFFFDRSTKSSKLLMKYKAYTDVTVRLIQDELNAGNLVANASGTFTFQGNQYNRNGTVTAKWNSTAYSSDSTYNEALRDEAVRIGTSRASSLTQKRGSPRWKGSIDLKGTNYVPGEVITYTSIPQGINDQMLRITDVTHQITSNGWSTSIDVEEDEPMIGSNIPNR